MVETVAMTNDERMTKLEARSAMDSRRTESRLGPGRTTGAALYHSPLIRLADQRGQTPRHSVAQPQPNRQTTRFHAEVTESFAKGRRGTALSAKLRANLGSVTAEALG